jgi:hypothetical protein
VSPLTSANQPAKKLVKQPANQPVRLLVRLPVPRLRTAVVLVWASLQEQLIAALNVSR